MVHFKNGRYELKSGLIGQGGQGSVLNGLDTQTNEQVAVKVIPITDPMARLSFQSEHRAASKLSSGVKNVCRVKDFVVEDGFGFLIMKRYDCDLFSFAFEMRESILQEEKIKVLFTKICKALKGLHKKGIAHLDLKPENILLDLRTMEPYICDFGSAFTSSVRRSCNRRRRSSDQAVPALGIQGTRKFSPPEMNDSPLFYDPFKADVYSLGVVLFALFTRLFPLQITDMEGRTSTDFSCAQKTMSPKIYSLLQSMVNPSPTERYSIDDVLSHEWITSNTSRRLKVLRKTRRQ